MSKISTESYKGVRDFYPEDMAIQNYMFDVMKHTCELFGYSEYSASILEPSELYRAKSGSEIVNEQTYSFIDRGGRDITIRPEMTPTVARMVAARKRELSFPLRWYSIPNVFRYEQPQRGRMREHWQLNVDIFGVASNEAEKELLIMSHRLMKGFAAKDDQFEIRINDRRIMNALFESFALTGEQIAEVSRAIDKKNKTTVEQFKDSIKHLFSHDSKVDEFIATIESNKKLIEVLGEKNPHVQNLVSLIDGVTALGVTNMVFDATLMRGFDYYTGIVFEVFDTNPENRKALFGGGRYDDLLSIFGDEKVPAVGFGFGDVRLRDFLETHNLLPARSSKTKVYIGVLDNQYTTAQELAELLRTHNISNAVDFTSKSPGDQLKKALTDGAAFFTLLGGNEATSKTIKIKNLATREEKSFSLSDSAGIQSFIQ